ncbi:MAG: hypothetical protein Q7K26_01440 [bacterium]|nr:hypothetical protein [bacterium]
MSSSEELQLTLNKLADQARNSWPGAVGEGRANDLLMFITKTLCEYSRILGQSEPDILMAIEAKRDYSASNYYQEANFPSLESVVLFDDIEAFKKRYPSGKYRCPSCSGESTNPYECNAVSSTKKDPCNWKSYGLFGTLGKGLRVALKNEFLSRPKIDEIFSPIEVVS